ncbi:hypothetical protein ACWDX6_06005 [Streptomyces sp. NPDC003027]
MAYRAAPVCEGEGCVRPAVGTVLDRRTGERCTSHGTTGGTSVGGTAAGMTTAGGMATAGGGMGGAGTGGITAGGGGGGTTTCTRYYDVKVEWPDRTGWLAVGSHTYGEVRTGDRAELRVWRGEAVRLVVRGRTYEYAPSSQGSVMPWLALGCLILAAGVWALVSGRPSGILAFPNFGWLFVAIGVGWMGSMALFGEHLLVWAFAIVWTGFAVFWTVGAWRVV